MSDGITFKTDMQFAYGEPSEMAPGVSRVVAPNASAFTFKGTNTYLVGTDSLAVIDPGPDDDDHLAAIVAAAAGRPITHILVTHAHRDHVDGLAALKAATGAKTAAFPRAAAAGAAQAPDEMTEFVDAGFVPSIRVPIILFSASLPRIQGHNLFQH